MVKILEKERKTEKTMLGAENLCKSYYLGKHTLPVLKEVSLALLPGEILAIVGPSGAGKSTLLHLLGLLDMPTSGEVYFQGERTSECGEEERAQIRNKKIGFVFQYHCLLPEFTALENVALAATIGNKKLQFSLEKARYFLTELGLGNRLNHRPNELSLGEAQRVALARALINEPEVILADEPTGNLDWETGEEVKYLLWKAVKRYGCSLLFVTHDEELAKDAERTLILIDGRLQ